MDEDRLVDYYHEKGMAADMTEKAVQAVRELEAALAADGLSLASATVESVSSHVDQLVAAGRNDLATLLALGRYFYLTDAREIYFYFTAILNSQGVLENIRGRISREEGPAAAAAAFDGVPMPVPGLPLKDMPDLARRLMLNLAGSLPREAYCRLLAGNNHDLTPESQAKEKEYYARADSLDAYLSERHRRKVEELQDCCDQGKIWYEQEITQEVVDFVRANQEILSAVRRGNKLFVTKIPYDTPRYLHARTTAQRSYYLCHCPFVRSAFLATGKTAANDGSDDLVPADWCYCSAGFAKFPFEAIFGTKLDIELLETPLAGHDRCRFAITLPEEAVHQRHGDEVQ